MRIELLKKHHDRTAFRCGESSLDDWLHGLATQWSKKGLSRVYVAVHERSPVVVGYYTLSSHHVAYDAMPSEEGRKMPPRVEIPAILLGRLAVDQTRQGTGLGRHLLFDAMARAASIASELGVSVLEVEALHEQARMFYLAHGLRSLADDRDHLFLPMSTIRRLELPPPMG